MAGPAAFVERDLVVLKGTSLVFRVKGHEKDGSVSIYGGTKDPNGYRQFRAVMPDRLRPATKGEVANAEKWRI